MHLSIHRVEKITVKEIIELKETNSYSFHIEVKSKDNSLFELVLFSDKAEKLLIKI